MRFFFDVITKSFNAIFNVFPIKMVTLKEYEANLRVKRIIDSCDEAEIISKLRNERNYTPMIIESEDISPTKCYSTSAAARHCGVTKQTLD